MKRKHSEANQDPSNLSQRITIDGHTPRNPKPQLCLLRTESQFVVGRQRSTDLKGILTELIEEFYPPLVCAICLDVSATRADSDMHFKAKHRGEKAFECLGHDCHQAYSSRSGLRYHLLTNHQVTGDRGRPGTSRTSKQKPAVTAVEGASKRAHVETKESNNGTSTKGKKGRSLTARKNNIPPATTNSTGLTTSLQKRLDELYPVTACPSCKEEFSKKTHVIRHLVEKHHGEEHYHCFVSECKHTKKYVTREGLIYHLVNYHYDS